MTSSEIAKQMIAFSRGNLHDIQHFLKVFAYARIIGESEKLSGQEQLTLEIAALLHGKGYSQQKNGEKRHNNLIKQLMVGYSPCSSCCS